MFLIPPADPFLLNSCAIDELLQFGDPNELQKGVRLNYKAQRLASVIHNLSDLELNVKYITEQGCEIKRISDTQIVVKKSDKNVPSKAYSSPIGIPPMMSPNPIASAMQRKDALNGSDKMMGTSLPPAAPAIRIPTKKMNGMNQYRIHSSIESGSESEPHSSFPESGGSLSPSCASFEEGIEFINKSPSGGTVPFQTKGALKLVVSMQPPTVPGEKLEKVFNNVILVRPNGKNVSATLYFTSYQLIILTTEKKDSYLPSDAPLMARDNSREVGGSLEIMVPLTVIARYEKVDRQNTHFMFGGEASYAIDVFFKDFRRTIRIILNRGAHSRREICTHLSRYVFPTLENVFAVASKSAESYLTEGAINGWNLYDIQEDYRRMGVGEPSSKWKFTDINKDYTVCETYCRALVVPTGIPDSEFMEVSGFRSKGRIPILSWRNRHTGVTMTRCSQPKTGMSRSFRCKADEKMVSTIQATNHHSNKMNVLDARPLANALANMALGGGYENLNHYPGCELKFLGIANIHVVRDSWNKLRDLCEANTPQKVEGDTTVATSSWLSQLEATHWLEHLSTILSSAASVVHMLEVKKESVLLHCSDGWDRTPQISSLVQILLDKHYRTLRGFCCLIEKEWLNYGHKFGDRIGLNFTDFVYKDTERSPIFFQFLDSVWQVMQQYPQHFEFSEDLLLMIAENTLSCRFGTFLFNSDYERNLAKIQEISPSIWTYILANFEKYLNPFYQPGTTEPSVIYPSTSVYSLQFWSNYYLKNLTPNPPPSTSTYVQLGRQMHSQIREMRTKVSELEDENAKLRAELDEIRNSGDRPKESLKDPALRSKILTSEIFEEWVDMPHRDGMRPRRQELGSSEGESNSEESRPLHFETPD